MSVGVVVAVLGAGVIGALIRFGVSQALGGFRAFPLAVLIVNVVGAAVGGVLLGLFERGAVSADLRLIIVTGFAGGLTTFSTWSVETIQLIQDGRWRTALSSVAVNLVLGLAVASAGYLLAR